MACDGRGGHHLPMRIGSKTSLNDFFVVELEDFQNSVSKL